MKNDQTNKQIRNVLMNEFGITREAVRDEINKIIVQTARDYLEHLNHGEQIQSMIREEMMKSYGRTNWSTPKLSREMDNAILKAIMNEVREKLTFSYGEGGFQVSFGEVVPVVNVNDLID